MRSPVDPGLPELALPPTVDALIDMLDKKAFPLTKPSVTATLAEIQREAGKRDVVDFLRRLQVERDERLGE